MNSQTKKVNYCVVYLRTEVGYVMYMFEMSLPHWPLDKKKSRHPAAFMRVNKCGFFITSWSGVQMEPCAFV
jgi:hypothetical protein